MRIISILIAILFVSTVSGCTSHVITEPPDNESSSQPSTYGPDEGFIEIGKQYDWISERDIIDVDGKLAFWAGLRCSSYVGGIALCPEYVIFYDGNEYGKEYKWVGFPKEINGNLGYSAGESITNKSNLFVYDGEEYPGFGQYIVTWSGVYTKYNGIYDIGGKPAFVNNQGYTWYEGKIFGEEYDSVCCLANINNKLAFETIVSEKRFVVYNGTEYGREYDRAHSPHEINGKLAFFSEKNGQEFIVHDGKEIGKEYDSLISKLWEINGSLVYQAKKGERFIIVKEGQEIGLEYNNVHYPEIINGKLAFKADKGGKSVIVFDSYEYGNDYDNVWGPFKIGNKLAFWAAKSNEEFIVYEGKEIGKIYEEVDKYSIRDIGGKLAFMARKDYRKFIVMEDVTK